MLPYNDLDAAEKIRKVDAAAVIVEPVAGAGGFIPSDKEYLERLREVCDETGAILIFDEVITGFRLAPGGAQELYGVKPDLTTFGKIVGGGEFAAGALGGRAELMELLDQIKYLGLYKAKGVDARRFKKCNGKARQYLVTVAGSMMAKKGGWPPRMKDLRRTVKTVMETIKELKELEPVGV